MRSLNLRKLLKKTREKRQLNKDRLVKAQEKLGEFKSLDIKYTALELLLESILDDTPGLTQQLEAALKQLEELNLKDGIW